MKLLKMLVVVWTVILLGSSAAAAGDFDWIKGFNIKAEADPSGFRTRIAAVATRHMAATTSDYWTRIILQYSTHHMMKRIMPFVSVAIKIHSLKRQRQVI